MSAPAAKPNVRDSLASLHAMLRAGHNARAEPIARQLQLAYPHRGDVNHMLALILSSLERPEHAEPYHARAVAADRRNVGYLLNYGLCLLRMGRIAEAAKYYEQASAIEPGNPNVIWRIGSFHLDLGQGEKALELFRKAYAAAPDRLRPAIQYEIVEALLSLGLGEEAEAEIRQHIATSPFRLRYLTRLAGIGKKTDASDVFSQIETILSTERLSPSQRSDLVMSKGRMLDNSGRYDEAFATILAAKRMLTASPPKDDFDGAVEGRMDFYTRDKVADLARRFGDPSKRHIFVVGLPRSGTTLATQILSGHSAIGSAGELETMTYIVKQLRGEGRPVATIEANLAAMGRDKAREFTDFYGECVRYLVPDGKRSVDKMPHNFRFCAEIAFLFPNARIVHCRRHPADTFVSAFQNKMNDTHSYSYSPETYASHYVAYDRLMRHWKSIIPDQIVDLDYERLTVEPRAVISELLTFLGLDWEEECLHPERNAGTVRTFSQLQVRSAINPSSVGRWRNYEKHLKPILDVYDALRA